MSNKKKSAKKKTKDTILGIQKGQKLTWVIILIILVLIFFFAVLKLGPFGKILNNFFSYVLSDLYCFAIIVLFVYGINVIFLEPGKKIELKYIVGGFLVVFCMMFLSALLSDSIRNFSLYKDFLIDGGKSIIDSNSEYPYCGGIIGNFFYVLTYTAFERVGAIILEIVLLIISLLLVVPMRFYKKFFFFTKDKTKEFKNDLKEDMQQLKEDYAEYQKNKENKKASHFIEIDEPVKKEPVIEEVVQEETKILEPKQDDSLKKARKKKMDEKVLSKKSKYFINLDDEEVEAPIENKPIEQNISIVKEKTSSKVLRPKKSNGSYHLPPFSLLDPYNNKSSNVNKSAASIKGQKVLEILNNFDIEAELVNTHIGPSVTKFEIKPDSSVKVNKIMNIQDNIKMELAAKDIRIEAPIPGRSAVGIEVPNVEPVPVTLGELMAKMPPEKKLNPLCFALGKDLMGKCVYCELEKMPHLLIAGATGSGKSVCINTILCSYLLKSDPKDLRLVLIDPKKVEFTPYHDIPHLLWPVITDATMASNMLKKAVVIMEQRYDAFADVGVRNIQGFNDFVDEHNANLKEGESPMEHMPNIVIVIDELADLMAIAKKDVEMSIQRLTQLARASGIHMIVATQRPSTDVITGIIKSNIPSRISFAVASSIDSRTIIDAVGAERLLGNGDMLYAPQGESCPIRLQGVYVTDGEIKRITEHCKNQAKPEYEDSYFEFLNNMNGSIMANAISAHSEKDDLYDEVVEYVKEAQKASTSLLQRKFGIGYNRAARLIDVLEDNGIVGPSNGSKPREVYIKKDENEEV